MKLCLFYAETIMIFMENRLFLSYSDVASNARTLAIERDWIVVICEDKKSLTGLNISLTLISLHCSLWSYAYMKIFSIKIFFSKLYLLTIKNLSPEMSAFLRRIDLSSKLLAPVLAGQVKLLSFCLWYHLQKNN